MRDATTKPVVMPDSCRVSVVVTLAMTRENTTGVRDAVPPPCAVGATHIKQHACDGNGNKEEQDKSHIQIPACWFQFEPSLVKRNGKFGVFYGCSNYPRIVRTFNIEMFVPLAGRT